ncbi:MAG TPA: diacylglycerol kinase family protein [Streptosporangiaceae bacterium]
MSDEVVQETYGGHGKPRLATLCIGWPSGGKDAIMTAAASGSAPPAPQDPAAEPSARQPGPPAKRQRWLARLAILLVAAAVGILIGFSDGHGAALIITGAAGACAMVAAGYWFLANRGVLRWAAGALVLLAPVAILVLYIGAGLLWVALVAIAALVLGLVTAHAAMGAAAGQAPAAGQRAARPASAFLIMNPRSGGGKVGQFSLKEKAEAAGAQVTMLDGPEILDVAELARRAVAVGADLLGVAGGDGTQALVAGVAADHDVPFLCISAGTRNHFAMDLGLDRDDPSRCLDALTDGVELRIDLGLIGSRTFVNNASFGAYAEVVRSPEYRDDKRGTTLQKLPDLLKFNDHRLLARAGSVQIDGPQALLVSNNQYETTDIAGLGGRARLDGGALGVVAVTVHNAAQAIGLMRRGRGRGLTVLATDQVTVDATQPEIPVGVDGETVMMPTPVRCAVRPRALRVVVPRTRPGTRAVRPALSWPRLFGLAGFGRRPATG